MEVTAVTAVMAAMGHTVRGEDFGAGGTATQTGGVTMALDGQDGKEFVAVQRPFARGHKLVGAGRLIAVLALVACASSASALIIDSGGPVYTLPAGGTCTVAGIATQTGGATVNCTGVNLSAYTHVYFGIRNDINVNGNTMTGTAPVASSNQFTWSSNDATSITYSSATSVNDFVLGAQAVTNSLVLTLASGTGSVVSTGGIPGNTGNGDIERLFEITAGSTFDVNVTVNATSPSFSGVAASGVYDPTKTALSGSSDISGVDVAFYFSECGDGVVDSPEACDDGGANGTSTSCCTSSCTFRTSGEVCRTGSGDACDTNETCTGASGSCPSDDAAINTGTVCRAGSGDSCDANETCTGVPGATCPADDAPGNIGVVCRVSSAGDVCDMNETCTGTPGATCPVDDAPGNLNMVCRSGSGDVCDPDELCTGVAGQGCPADVVSNPATVCRSGSGDSCDPDEFCTAIPGVACPADVLLSSGTTCRAAAGSCDVEEQCSGTPTDPCPVDGFAPSATSCNDDMDLCTTDECDGGGTCVFVQPLNCDDGNSCTQDSCDAIGGCDAVGVPAGTATCVGATKATFKYKDKFNDSGDKVVFVWKGGPAPVSNLGDPTQTTGYELCVYDNSGVQLALDVDPGAGWKTLGPPSDPKGYKFKDTAAAQDGVKLLLVKGSTLDKGKAKVVAKKGNLPDTATTPFQFPITAELYADNGMCWTVEFGNADTKKNEAGKYIGKVK